MAKEPIQNNQFSDETDILALLKYFERGILKIINFFGSILKFFYSVIIYSLKAIITNIKIIAIVVVLGAITGYVLEKYAPKKYQGKMLVRTYFDSQYQVSNNIDYYNALIADKNYTELKEIFKIDEEELRELIEFTLELGPETENEKILKYDNFLKQLDSVRAQEISYEDYIQGRDILTGDLFEVKVIAKRKDIFTHLEEGLFNSFQNLYSIKKKEKRDSLVAIQKVNLREAIAEIDSLQNVYINVLEEEASATKASINLGQGFPLTQEKSNTKEYQLLNKEIELRERLRELDETMIQQDVYFDVIAGFQKVGSEYKKWSDRYIFLLPALGFLVLCFISIWKKLSIYVRNYEG